MKNLYFLLVLMVNVLIVSGQGTEIGITYIRNDRYLLSFNKVMYPGYVLRLENFHLREYLIDKLIQDTLIKGSFETEKSEVDGVIKFSFSMEDLGNFCIPIYTEDQENEAPCLGMYMVVEFKNNQIIKEDCFVDSRFQVYSSSSVPLKRLSKSGDKVEVFQINSEINTLNNIINQEEKIIESRALKPNEIVDLDGNIYLTTAIGDQVWMAENLRVTRFNNGLEIPFLTNDQWINSTAPGITIKNPEGVFYNYYTLLSDNNVCPQGFHVPNNKDISTLYNEITPYQDHLKISGSVVKKKVYPRIFTPITYPLFSAVHLIWWSAAASIDAGLMSLAVASDAVLYGTELLTSPIFGWKTKKGQYKENLKNAERFRFINSEGIPLIFNKNDSTFKMSNLNSINPENWSRFKLVLPTGKLNSNNEFEGEIVTDKNRIDSVKSNFIFYTQYHLKFKPFYFPWSTTLWFAQSDYFSEYNGLFGGFDFRAYQSTNESDYERKGYTSSLGRFDRQPVISLLFNKGENEFADEFGFNLNHNNTLVLAGRSKKGKGGSQTSIDLNSTGISYLDGYNYPGYFGIIKNQGNKGRKGNGPGVCMECHELNMLDSSEDDNILKSQTRVRCIKN